MQTGKRKDVGGSAFPEVADDMSERPLLSPVSRAFSSGAVPALRKGRASMTSFRLPAQPFACIASAPDVSGIPADEIPDVTDAKMPQRKKTRPASQWERQSFLRRTSIAARQARSDISPAAIQDAGLLQRPAIAVPAAAPAMNVMEIPTMSFASSIFPIFLLK